MILPSLLFLAFLLALVGNALLGGMVHAQRREIDTHRRYQAQLEAQLAARPSPSPAPPPAPPPPRSAAQAAAHERAARRDLGRKFMALGQQTAPQRPGGCHDTRCRKKDWHACHNLDCRRHQRRS